jgi:hypothetical protein
MALIPAVWNPNEAALATRSGSRAITPLRNKLIAQ